MSQGKWLLKSVSALLNAATADPKSSIRVRKFRPTFIRLCHPTSAHGFVPQYFEFGLSMMETRKS